MKAYKSFNTRSSSVREPIFGEQQIVNNDGGYVYELDMFKTLERFLILGTEGGSFYVGEKKLTKEAAVNVIKCIEADGKKTVDSVVAISDSGRALKNDPALFALALAASAKDPSVRAYALAALPRVARIPTHLFHFVEYVTQFRGWGRGLKRAIGEWYNNKDVENLAYSVVKYQQRDGWSNADLLRLSHPKTSDEVRSAVYKWIVDGYQGVKESSQKETPVIIDAFESSKTAKTSDLIHHIAAYNLSREMLPTEALNNAAVWEALLQKMPPHALLRNLAKMTAVGLLKPLSDASRLVIEKLTSDNAAQTFAEKRVHPVAILLAMKQYAEGRGLRGSLVWTPVPSIIDALNDAFYSAFKYATPTGKAHLIGVDCSGSMANARILGVNLTAAEGAAAMAMACARLEKNYHVICFDSRVRKEATITPNMRLDTVIKETSRLSADYTHLEIPMKWALENKVKVDVFEIITDNEVNFGRHPKQAIVEYRQKAGVNAKQVVMGMTATNMTIADPKDPLSLDVAGFDASVPQAVQEFTRI